MDPKDPFVVLLDLDHTIQGNIQPQLNEHSLIEHINQNAKGLKRPIRDSRDFLHRDFLKGLLRPNFKPFLARMRSIYPNVEFFVYTASEDAWAKHMIKAIESFIQTKINHKFFARSDCELDTRTGQFMKSVDKLRPKLHRILKAKYKLPPDYKFKHIVLVDNNDVLPPNETHYLIKCPHYMATVNIDITRCVPLKIVRENVDLISKFVMGRNEKSLTALFRQVHAESFNTTYPKDNFWETLLKALKKSYSVAGNKRGPPPSK